MVAVMVLADSFEDPERARVIYLAAGGLVVVALLLIAGTVWWWRSAAVEHPALAPLEVMSGKSWWKGDHRARRQDLDSVRPDGAQPGDGSLVVPDPVDLRRVEHDDPLDFDDLREPELEDTKAMVATARPAAPMDPLLRMRND
jgi:hypothetical protein